MEFEDRGVDVLHIILLILKILGCILLALLGILLILLCIILFVPIKYKFSGAYLEKPDMDAKVSWLFGLIKAQAKFRDQSFNVCVKVAWKQLFNMDKELKKQEASDLDETEESTKNMDSGQFAEKDKDVLENHSESVQLESPNLDQKNVSNNEAVSQTRRSNEEISFDKTISNDFSKTESKEKHRKKSLKKDKDKAVKSNADKQSVFEIIMIKLEQLIDKIDMTAEKAEEKLDQLSCRLNKVDRFLSAECTQNSLLLARRMLFSILKHIAPKRVSGHIHFGMDKPSKTGRILGYASAFYPLYADSIQIDPDFEKTVIEGDLNMSGGIQLYIFVFWGLRIILCKDVRKVIKYVKRLKK